MLHADLCDKYLELLLCASWEGSSTPDGPWPGDSVWGGEGLARMSHRTAQRTWGPAAPAWFLQVLPWPIKRWGVAGSWTERENRGTV